MSISAMKQALEALNIIKASFSEGRMAHAENEAAIAEHILRQAIAEAEKQEPVSIKKVAKAHGIDMPDHFRDATKKVVPSDHTNSHQPVAWREVVGKTTHYYDYNEDGRGEPLYTAPITRQKNRQVAKNATTGNQEVAKSATTDNQTPECKTDPRAPHGFDRNASHSADRYVCECESWEPNNAA